MIPTGLQDWIYKLEEGAGAQYLKVALAILALLGLGAVYDIREFRNLKNPEAMEAAQLARNIASGKGYTTDCIRPLAITLLQKKAGPKPVLKSDIPDITTAPLYPLILAGWMKFMPFRYEIPNTPYFGRYQPDVLIALLNQGFFLIATILLFRLAKTLFDPVVAWVSTIAFATADLFWRFSISGLSTMLVIVFFLALVLCLVAIEKGVREQTASAAKLFLWAALAGVALGLSALTRYSTAWLVLPVIGFLLWVGGPRRYLLAPIPLVILILGLAPWVARNYALSGAAFGTASFAIHQETPHQPGNRLERAMPKNLDQELEKAGASAIFRKLLVETSDILQNAIPRLGESWLAAFFLVSLVMSFKSEAIKRVRLFLVASLAVLLVAQALTKTNLTNLVPAVNSENLLAILAPVAFIYGAAMFLILLDAVEWTFAPLRLLAIGGFVTVLAGPLIFLLLPPRESPVAYPPYYPPLIQEPAGWMRSDELMMSDIPWAVAWYGNRKTLLVTLDAGADPQGDFFTINDLQKPIQALLLSPLTMDSRFLSEMIRGKEGVWGKFVLEGLLRTNVPPGFPLKRTPGGFLPDYLYLSDRNRWPKNSK